MEIEQEWYRVYCRDPFPNARLSVGAQQLPFSVPSEKVQAKTLHLHIVPVHKKIISGLASERPCASRRN